VLVLNNKTILLISPNNWGTMHISKHHYAIELARLGNTVFFLNPPNQEITFKKKIDIIPIKEHPNLYCINHDLPFPYHLKFRFTRIFHFLMGFYIKSLQKKIGKPLDIVWSFDLNYIYPFSLFPKKAIKILHPVDEPGSPAALKSAIGADIIFSVTREILEKYQQFSVPKIFINHGLSNFFLSGKFENKTNGQIRVGFSGNLIRHDLDRSTFLQIISENPSVLFECWGSYKPNELNIGGHHDQSAKEFIAELSKLPNVILHGAVPPSELKKGYARMDAFLICYDVERDVSKGTNYHKVIEFLCTGKVIVSNNITTYQQRPDLVQMVPERNTNASLPGLFRNVLSSLEAYNAETLREKRILFSHENTYEAQIKRIDKYLAEIKK